MDPSLAAMDLVRHFEKMLDFLNIILPAGGPETSGDADIHGGTQANEALFLFQLEDEVEKLCEELIADKLNLSDYQTVLDKFCELAEHRHCSTFIKDKAIELSAYPKAYCAAPALMAARKLTTHREGEDNLCLTYIQSRLLPLQGDHEGAKEIAKLLDTLPKDMSPAWQNQLHRTLNCMTYLLRDAWTGTLEAQYEYEKESLVQQIYDNVRYFREQGFGDDALDSSEEIQYQRTEDRKADLDQLRRGFAKMWVLQHQKELESGEKAAYDPVPPPKRRRQNVKKGKVPSADTDMSNT